MKPHWIRILARVDDGQTYWGFTCDTCGYTEPYDRWLLDYDEKRSDSLLHALYPRGIGDADEVLKDWSGKR